MDKRTYTAASSIIKLRDNARRLMAEHPDLPRVGDYSRGQLDAYEISLGALAGVAGFLTRQGLELAVQIEAERRLEAKKHRPEPRTRDEALEADRTAEPPTPWRGTADPEPMGGWEPRS